MIAEILFSGLIAASAHASDFIESIATPQDETTVFGEGKQSNGSFNVMLIEQPQNSPNPLGSPIYEPTEPSSPFSSATTAPAPFIQSPQKNIEQNSLQNPSVSQMSPQAMNQEIQNKLYQSGNRIYDIQSYPANDINYINQNSQDNAITNYPAY